MKAQKNISRYDSGRGSSYSFKGWRLCVTRQKERFVRYFSDREYGGSSDAALTEALKMRDEILEQLEQGKEEPSALFARYRKVYH